MSRRGKRLAKLGRTGWLTLALVFVVPAVALAAIAAVIVTDPGDDSPTKFDIASVDVDTTGDGMIRHVVTMANPFGPTDMVAASGPRPAVCILIWTKRTAGDDRPDYRLCAYSTEDARKLRGTLEKVPTSGLPRRVKIIDTDRPSDRAIALEVTPRDLGSPRSYRFSAQVQGPAGPSVTCGKFTGCVDYAPQRGTFQTFRP